MSNYSDLPNHVLVFSSTVINIETADKDEDGDVHGCVDNDAPDDDTLSSSSIDDLSCMSEDAAYLEQIRVLDCIILWSNQCTMISKILDHHHQ